MRAVAAALAFVVSTGCASTRSLITVPPCTREVRVEGQHARRDARTLELDHTFELPFSRTRVVVTRPGGVVEEIEIVASEPDWIRLFVGGALYLLGGVLLTSAAYGIAARGEPATAPGPLVGLLWGGAALVVGTAAAATGWHPPHSTVVEDQCVERGR